MNIICKIFGHKPDIIKLVDNKIYPKNNTDECLTNCKRCDVAMSYDECFKKYSIEFITILQKKIIKQLNKK